MMNWRDKYLNKIVCGDCLELMPELPDNVADLILTDPPYYKVKGEAWDRQWKNPAAYLEWLGGFIAEWHRLLKPNGSLYCFASPKMAARVELAAGGRFNVLNNIVWRKGFPGEHSRSGAHRSHKEDLRCFNPETERIIFAEHYGADNIAKGESGYGAKCDELRGFVFEPLRAYLDGERKRAGFSDKEMREHLKVSLKGGGLLSHYWGKAQWQLPTPEHYAALRNLFNRNGGEYLHREYEDLHREYEDLRVEFEELRRPFSVTAQDQYTDVWEFPTVKHYPGKHPCEKPAALIEHVINVSSKPGALILDTFSGSGVVADVAKKLGRDFIAVDSNENYCEIARKRLAQECLCAV